MRDVFHEPHQPLVPVHQRQGVERCANAEELVFVFLSVRVVHLVRRDVAVFVRGDVALEPANLAEVPRARIQVAFVVHHAERGVQPRVRG